ncbi:hypothetical protein [Halomonas sp. 11-S5]|uniref:hypothetical protein n=1 Tax=Halomonas sp. 11-S5 TaxID=2994064 RepID=UPI002469A5F5|nr:hypothetical protein [Halomonas sp. 11-S5]
MQRYPTERAAEIPDKPGLYSFSYNPFQKKRLGIYKDQEIGDERLSAALKVVKKKLSAYNNLASKAFLSLDVAEYNAGGRKENSFRGEVVNFDYLDQVIGEESGSEAYRFLSFLESASQLFRPLYCGMTFNQSLKTRYFQHKRDYDKTDYGTFGSRLRESGFLWPDIIFTTIEIPHANVSEDELRKMEKLLIVNSNPILNNR